MFRYELVEMFLGCTKCILLGHGICVITLKEKSLGKMPLGSLKTKIYV